MSSVFVAELKAILECYPDDYEVVMDIRTKDKEGETQHNIVYINGVQKDELFKEIKLMN